MGQWSGLGMSRGGWTGREGKPCEALVRGPGAVGAMVVGRRMVKRQVAAVLECRPIPDSPRGQELDPVGDWPGGIPASTLATGGC